MRKVRRSDLLFAFDAEFDVGAEGARLHHGFQGLDVHVELSFVVAGTAGIDLSVLDDRIEGAAVPEFQWIGGLYVIVSVNQHRRQGGIDDALAVHDGVTGRLMEFGACCSGFQQAVAYGFCAGDHICLVFAAGADGRDPQQGQQFFQESVAMLVMIRFPGVHSIDLRRAGMLQVACYNIAISCRFNDPRPCLIDIFLLYLTYDCKSSSAFIGPTDHERKVPVEAEPILA